MNRSGYASHAISAPRPAVADRHACATCRRIRCPVRVTDARQRYERCSCRALYYSRLLRYVGVVTMPDNCVVFVDDTRLPHARMNCGNARLSRCDVAEHACQHSFCFLPAHLLFISTVNVDDGGCDLITFVTRVSRGYLCVR